MQRYEPSTPRVFCGFTAALMTAITIGTFVLVPAETEAVATSCTAPVTAKSDIPRSPS
jgi:hypothetical protein